MQRKLLRLLILLFFLGFSLYVLSASAVPATRTQNLNGEDTPVLPFLAKWENLLKFGNGEEELLDVNKGYTHRRIDLEIQDYEGTGANKDHDPKSPGRV
ncbi:hypothetical protein TanjilG_22737 [Lupinus angustifolius]|uniref:Uncharacterized protein n=1 Tax=Lupinus angustifolius TaxID=3871 RepID=A0A4P1RF16_LUPAN|nr:PREDICTED: uncharacterized protein LOC109350943 [Lupinus angustifolius]OIW09463.1 hypothetical protein TanjilG_22737 [Lupinus angustifolius]